MLHNPELGRSEEEFAVSHLKINGKIGKRRLLLRGLHLWVLQRALVRPKNVGAFTERFERLEAVGGTLGRWSGSRDRQTA